VDAREADLDAWMSRLAGGDRSAFEPLYLALRTRARRLATMRLGETAADDVTQSALLRVFDRASEFTPGKPCLPWFYAIVVNEIRAAQRKDARQVPTDIAADAIVDSSDDAESQMIERELGRALGSPRCSAVRRCPPARLRRSANGSRALTPSCASSSE
jgi:DNA-directed RNA polymerase specialized sigma24 family protein